MLNKTRLWLTLTSGMMLLIPFSAQCVDFGNVPGVVLDHQSLSYWGQTTPAKYISDPEIAVLSDGSYVACHAYAGWFSGSSSSGETSIFRSTDQGITWSQVATLSGLLRGSLVEYGGALYMLGVDKDDGGQAVVCKSTDYGVTWTQTATFSNGGSATPNNPVVFGDRLWSAASAASMSAPITSNWMNTASWRLVGGFPAYEEGWASEGEFIGEAQIAASPEQGISILPKVKQHALSALAQVDPSTGKVSFDPWHNFVSLPGGEKKFGAGYDAVSGRFFVLSNPILPAHSNTSIANDLIRNTAALLSSPDLVNWNVEKIFLYSTDYETDGFGYLNFDVDGDDMVVASRTAFPVGGDDPERGHDSNLLTFHRIDDFRTAAPDHVLKLSGGDVLRYEKTDYEDAPLGSFALGATFDGAALTNPDGFGQAAGGDVYIRESGGRILQFDAAGNFLQTVSSAPVSFQSSELSIDPPSDGECSWVSSGSGDWFEPLNWHYWGRADTADETAVFGSAATGPATVTVPSGSLEWLFNTENDPGGWTLTRLVNTNVTGGVLQGTPSSNDPQIKRTDLSFYGNLVPSIVVRMRAAVSNARVDLYWGTAAANSFAADRLRSVNYSGNGEFQDLVFPLAGHAQWDDQVIRSIRIDPLNGPLVALEVDSIEILHTHHVKGITFRNSQPYTLDGSQLLVIQSEDGLGRLTVEQGSHEIQAELSLESDTVFLAVTNTSLRITGGLDLNGKTLAVSGAGRLIITNSCRLEGGTLSIADQTVVTLDPNAGGFDGTLEFSVPENFDPEAGEVFHFIDGIDGTTNRFDSVVLPVLEDGLDWELTRLYIDGSIEVVDTGTALPSDWTAAVSSDWFDAGNWSGPVPTNGSPQEATLFITTPAVVAGGDAAVSTLYVGQNSPAANLQVDSGSLTGSGAMLLAYSNHRAGSYTQAGGDVSVDSLQASRDANCLSTMTISGGTFASDTTLVLGKQAKTTYVQTGGSVSAGTVMLLGSGAGGAADITLSDGAIAVAGDASIGTGLGSSSILRLNGGTMDIGGVYTFGGSGSATNILSGGVLTVGGQLVRKAAGTTFEFNSGTLCVFDMAWNGDLEVGNGTDRATLILQENADEHVVNADVLSINSNSFLFGAGVLTGGAAGKRVGVKAGGVLSAGEGNGQIGTFTIGENQALVLGDGSVVEFEADASGADLIAVSDTLAFVSNSTVAVTLTDLGGADFSQDQVLLTYGTLINFDQVNWVVDTSGAGGGNLWVANDSVAGRLILTPDAPPASAVSFSGFGSGQDVINWTVVEDYGRLEYGLYYSTNLLDGFVPLTNLDSTVTRFTNAIDASPVFYKITAE